VAHSVTHHPKPFEMLTGLRNTDQTDQQYPEPKAKRIGICPVHYVDCAKWQHQSAFLIVPNGNIKTR